MSYGLPIWKSSHWVSHNWKRTEKSHETDKKYLKGFELYRDWKKLDLPTLNYRRFREDLVQVYKITNQIDNLKFDTFFTQTKWDTTRNAEHKLYVEHSKTNARKFTFTNRIAPAWNALSLITKVDLYQTLTS